jgi:Flp pilus assembly protein protease CpaA
MPTGWRPAGFEESYPVSKIDDVYHFEKYRTKSSKKLLYWSIFQLFTTLLLVSYMFSNIATIGLPNLFVYGLFVFVTIYSYSELMDRKTNALFWEGLRLLFGVGILMYYSDWFGLSKIINFSTALLLFYLIGSFAMTFYFTRFEFRTTVLLKKF